MATKPIWSDNLEHDTVLYKIMVFTKLARDEKKKFCDAPKSERPKTDSGKLCTLYIVLFITVIMIMHDLLSLHFHYNKSWFLYFSTVV